MSKMIGLKIVTNNRCTRILEINDEPIYSLRSKTTLLSELMASLQLPERLSDICKQLLKKVEKRCEHLASGCSAIEALKESGGCRCLKTLSYHLHIDESDGFGLANHSFNLRYTQTSPSPEDFNFLKMLAGGAFGQVFLAMKKKTKDYFAIKVQKKSHLLVKNNITRINSEHKILSKVANPFIVKLFYSFQSEDNLYLVMDYLPGNKLQNLDSNISTVGGDCLALLDSLGQFDEELTRVYIAETLLAIEYCIIYFTRILLMNLVHNHSIVHRDLKPDNMLISIEGHIKLSDFGLSVFGLQESKHLVESNCCNQY